MGSRRASPCVLALLLSLLELLAHVHGAPPNGSGHGRLNLPPILEGYHGKRYKTKSGGLVDVTLSKYISTTQFFNSRGTWYDITKWAARTHHCDNHPSSVVCMACAMNMPSFTRKAGVVPIAVSDELFGLPEKGATCGMCLRIYMPQNYTSCTDHETQPFCRGYGTHSYFDNVRKPWVWNGKILYDKKLKLHYFTAIIIEWFDRVHLVPYQITLPTQGVGPTNLFGDWPVKYKAVPCPVRKHGMEMQFLDFSTPLPVESGICNNQFNEPCGGSKVPFPGQPLGFMKLMITSQRIPISLVEVFLSHRWISFKRSGDGYWQPGTPGFAYRPPPLNGKLRVRISCASGSKPKVVTVVPGKMLCSYQNPKCYGRQLMGVQC